MELQVTELRDSLPRLSGNDRSFAESLLSQHERGKALSSKQQYWVGKLCERATAPVETKTEKVGDLSGVIALIETARKHLKHPAIVLGYGDGHELRLTVATANARVPGSVNVVDNDSRVWFGRVHTDGTFEHSRRDEPPAALGQVLAAFALDPARVASEHGRLTGHCCFCNTALTDERSTSVGYGKTCAAHYGLPWGARH